MEGRDSGAFCRAYLRTMDPERAAAECGRRDGFSLLGSRTVQERLEKMRTDAASQLRREDVLRRPGEGDPEGLDLSAVAEFKVTDKGGVEVKLVDRVRALETLCSLLDDGGGRGAEALYQALAEGCGETEEGWDNG